jgi:carboxypeptidase Taq
MLRFELELQLMEGTLHVADLPDAWNEKFKAYLGITPPDDAKGVLQDIHWSAGLIGYFPTYALGNLIASQLWEKIRQEIPALEDKIGNGEFGDLKQWLREEIHQHGAKFEPVELLRRVLGTGLNADPYVRYLEAKFGEIYEL